MKYFISALILITFLSFRFFDDIYNLSLKTIDGQKINLADFRGKKMLFVILPVSPSDTTVSFQGLSQLQSRYINSLVVIGIPAEEYGFKKGDDVKVKKLYKKDTANFIIAEGMKVKKGAAQSPVFQWLTDKNKNQHFDHDTRGVGSKFFVDEKGELYAVMGAQLKLSDPMIDKILARGNVKKQ